MDYLILSPSDIYYLTGVRIHEVGEVMILLAQNQENKEKSKKKKEGNIQDYSVTQNSSGIIFCDPRTSGLFRGANSPLNFHKKFEGVGGDSLNWKIIDTRDGWEKEFKSLAQTPPIHHPPPFILRRIQNIILNTSENGTCTPSKSSVTLRISKESIRSSSSTSERVSGGVVTDPDFLTQTLREKLEKYGLKLVTKPSPVTSSRLIKAPQEIEKLRKSQQLNKQVFQKIQPFLVPGVTESEIARKILIFQLELGASGPSFAPIVAFGPNSAVPHHSSGDRKLQLGEIVLIDMGLVYEGYCSDMTRTFFVGQGQEEEQKSIVRLLETITRDIISWAKPGMTVRALDQKARKMMGKYEQYFTHSLGHGVGIDIHESPSVSSKSREVLKPGMVITIEPGLYFVERKEVNGKREDARSLNSDFAAFGARYEEMVLVTEKGMETL